MAFAGFPSKFFRDPRAGTFLFYSDLQPSFDLGLLNTVPIHRPIAYS